MEQRDFLPRLGAPLCNIACSPDGMFYATSHTDNGKSFCGHECEERFVCIVSVMTVTVEFMITYLDVCMLWKKKFALMCWCRCERCVSYSNVNFDVPGLDIENSFPYKEPIFSLVTKLLQISTVWSLLWKKYFQYYFRRMNINFLIFSVIQLITSNFHINFAIRGLARAHLGADVSKCDLPLGLIFDPRSKALVTNGRPGHLQFYCLRTDTQLFHVSL